MTSTHEPLTTDFTYDQKDTTMTCACGPDDLRTCTLLDCVEKAARLPWDEGNPEPLPSVMPLPDPARFGVIGGFAAAVAESLEQPPDYALLACLSAVSGATLGRIDVQVQPGHTEALSIYTMPAMESGTRKSEAMARVTAPLWKWERDRFDDYRASGAEIELELAEASLEALKKSAVKRDDRDAAVAEIQDAQMKVERLRALRPNALFADDDVTPEALGIHLSENGEAGFIASAEGGFIGVLAGRYSARPNIDVVLKGHNNEPCGVARVGRPALHLSRPHIALCIGAQPHVLSEMRGDDAMRERGFLARFLVALPDDGLGYRTGATVPMNATAQAAWDRAVVALVVRCSGALVPFTMAFTDEAREDWQREWRRIEAMLRPDGALGGVPGLRSWGGKLAGELARVAAAFTLADDPAAHSVDLTHWRMAADLIDYFVSHAQMVWTPRLHGPAQRVLDYLSERRPWDRDGMANTDGTPDVPKWVTEVTGAFTTREAHRALRGQTSWVSSVDSVRAALLVLADRGWVRPVERDGDGRPGHPSEAWQVHALLMGGAW